METIKRKSRKRLTAWERFFNLVNTQNACWLWTGAHHAEGYGVFNPSGPLIGSHRWIYRQVYGPIPKGFEIDHLCKVTACVRPSHLEAVTPSENVKRSRSWHHFIRSASKVKACPKGHPYDDENTYLDKQNCRHCKTCNREQAKKYQTKKRHAKAEEVQP